MATADSDGKDNSGKDENLLDAVVEAKNPEVG